MTTLRGSGATKKNKSIASHNGSHSEHKHASVTTHVSPYWYTFSERFACHMKYRNVRASYLIYVSYRPASRHQNLVVNFDPYTPPRRWSLQPRERGPCLNMQKTTGTQHAKPRDFSLFLSISDFTIPLVLSGRSRPTSEPIKSIQSWHASGERWCKIGKIKTRCHTHCDLLSAPPHSNLSP